MDFDIDSPVDFKDPDLRKIDELIRCPICCEIMVTATLVVKCTHNFCSICVRRHVESKKECPICKEKCTEASLVTNKLINQISEHYRSFRPTLKELDKQLSGVGDETRETEEPDNKPPTNKTSRHIMKVKERNPKNSQSSLSQKFKIKKRCTEVKTVGEVSSYYEVSGDKRQKISSLPSSSSSGSADLQECPVCGCSVPAIKVNQHLDLCLKRKAREKAEEECRPVKKKLPSLVWTIFTDKKLREQCKSYGLSTMGKKPELIKRLKEYTLRHNSQINQIKQKSGRQLAREVEEMERVKLTSPPGVVGRLKTDQDRRDYSIKHNANFVSLINSARLNKGPKTRQSDKIAEDDDELKIIHEVPLTPQKKCQGTLKGFFDRSPGGRGPPDQEGVLTPPQHRSTPQETPPQHRSSTPSTPQITPPNKSSEAGTSRGSPKKLVYNVQGSSGDEDLFEDMDIGEIERSLTQSQNPSFIDSGSKEMAFSPQSPAIMSTVTTPTRKRTPRKSTSKSNILEQVLEAEFEQIEDEVNRLYSYPHQNENVDSANTSSTFSKLDRLLEKSYKTPKPRSFAEDSIAEMLLNLSSTPPQLPLNLSGGRSTPPCRDEDEDDLPEVNLIDSPPPQIPSLDEDLLNEAGSQDDLPEDSPVIKTGLRLRKRCSGSPLRSTSPKRGRIL